MYCTELYVPYFVTGSAGGLFTTIELGNGPSLPRRTGKNTWKLCDLVTPAWKGVDGACLHSKASGLAEPGNLGCRFA